ncbi:MAG TPA: recombinase family protein [Polyangia bacterium]|nr:recombinase family protein [Polyangia bacterium]
MKSYLAYTRVSTVKQGEHGSSLHEQKSAIEAYARHHALQIAEWFEETETAAKLGRRLFNRMMGELEKGRAAGVIIHKIDRSARNLKDWAQLGELIDRGIEVHFAHESLDLASRGGRLSADIQAVVAADYIRNLRQEVRKGFYGRLKQGFYPLPAPRGYLDQGKAKPKLIDPAVGPLVREAFDLYATGSYSLPTLLEEMCRRGLRGKTGKPLALDAISRMLHNPFYVGQIRIDRTGETFQGIHEPLVRQVVFDRVQAVMAGRTFARPQKHDPVFRRMIRCAACGYSLIGEIQKGHTYYRCHSRACRGTSIREEHVSAGLSAFFDLLVLSEEEFGDLRDLVEEAVASRAVTAGVRRAETRRRAAQCDGRLTRLTDAFLDENIDKETFEGRKAELLKERRALLDAIAGPDEEPEQVRLLKNLELGKMAQQAAESPFRPEFRERVKSTTSNLALRGKELEITALFPFGDLAKWRFSQHGAPCSCTPRNGDASCVVCMTRASRRHTHRDGSIVLQLDRGLVVRINLPRRARGRPSASLLTFFVKLARAAGVSGDIDALAA